jgi:hypothetical protein
MSIQLRAFANPALLIATYVCHPCSFLKGLVLPVVPKELK